MVYGSAYAEHGILTGLQRKSVPVPAELPHRVRYRHEIGQPVVSFGIPDQERIACRGVVRMEGAEAETVQIAGLKVVVVYYHILVGLVIALGRGLAAAAGIYLLDHQASRAGVLHFQDQFLSRRNQGISVCRGVEHVLPVPVAGTDAVQSGRQTEMGAPFPVGRTQICISEVHILGTQVHARPYEGGIVPAVVQFHRQIEDMAFIRVVSRRIAGGEQDRRQQRYGMKWAFHLCQNLSLQVSP